HPSLMASATPDKDIHLVVRGEHPNPFGILGMHRAALVSGPVIVIRAFLPDAEEVRVVGYETDAETVMECVDPAGFFEVTFPDGERFGYRLRVRWSGGATTDLDDPYTFPSTLGELDLHLLGEG